MSNTSKELIELTVLIVQQYYKDGFFAEEAEEEIERNPQLLRVRDKVMEWHAQQLDKALEQARSKDPHKCEYGHEVYSHNTASGWCCACEADQAFMENEIERRIASLKQQLKDKDGV